MRGQSAIKIITEWDIVAAKQMGRDVAKAIGFNSVDQARITTAISELARNIYLYAQSGEIIIEDIQNDQTTGIAITAVDRGPGIVDARRILDKGYSTSSGLGTGLSGIKRLMDYIELDSVVGQGTTIRIEKWL